MRQRQRHKSGVETGRERSIYREREKEVERQIGGSGQERQTGEDPERN